MNKEDFLDELAKRLSGLPQEDIDERIAFYREMIYARMEEGLSEEEATASIGTVDDVVRKIMSEYPLTTLVKDKVKPKRKLATWEIILLVLGFPLWFPLLIGAFAIVLSIYITIWAVIISLFAADFSCLAGCLGGLVGIFQYLRVGNFAGALFSVGAALVCAGVAILMFIACVYIAKAVIILTRKVVLGIKNSFVGKEVAA